jgi:mannosyltransferase OCH1-like enzyme
MFSINKIKFSLLKYLYQNKKIIVTEQDFISIWKSDIFTLEIKNRKAIPKIIWAFWDSKEMPELVKICINNWKELHPDFEINILNNETIHTFLPNFPKLKDFNPVFKSDLLRLSLLKEYGGIYLDASVFLNQRLDQYISFYIENNLDLLVFSSEGHPNDKKYPITENWFIISEKNNLFIEKWLFYVTEVFLSNDFESYFKNNETRKMAYNSVNETKRDYFFSYMASQLVMREITNTTIGFLDSTKNGFFYNYYFKFNYEKIAKFLLLQTKFSRFPSIIKLIAKNRTPIEEMIKNKCYRKNSLFGKYINN